MLEKAREGVAAFVANVALREVGSRRPGPPGLLRRRRHLQLRHQPRPRQGGGLPRDPPGPRPGGRFVVSDVVAEEALPESVRSDPAAWAACYGGAIPEADYLAAVVGAGFATVEVLERTEPYEKGGVLVRSLTLQGTK